MKDRQNIEINARGRSKFLSHAEELALVSAWQKEGDERARVALIDAYMPMLQSFTARASRSPSDRDDILQEAIIGFTIALDRYDTQHGIRLGRWAKCHVQKELRDYRLANCAPIRLPNSRRTKDMENRVIGVINELEKVYGVKLTRAQKELICRDERFELSDLDDYLSITAPTKPIEASTDDEGGVEISADDPGAAEELAAQRTGRLIRETVDGLEERARHVIRRRYFCDEKQPSLEVVAAELGISRERAGQLERAALSDLRTALRKRGLELGDLVA